MRVDSGVNVDVPAWDLLGPSGVLEPLQAPPAPRWDLAELLHVDGHHLAGSGGLDASDRAAARAAEITEPRDSLALQDPVNFGGRQGQARIQASGTDPVATAPLLGRLAGDAHGHRGSRNSPSGFNPRAESSHSLRVERCSSVRTGLLWQ